MEKNNRIENAMNKLVFLLKSNYEEHWSFVLEKLLTEYQNATLKEEVIKKILSIYKGGMGCFNDCVLLRNHVIPIGASLRETVGEEEYLILKNENETLKTLNNELYEACIEYERGSPQKKVVDNVYPLHRKG